MVNRGSSGGGDGGSSGGSTWGETSSLSQVVKSVIDTGGKGPTLLVGALVARIIAAIWLGFEIGFISFIRTVGDGIYGTFDDLETWLADQGGLIPAVINIPAASWQVSVRETAAFVGSAGVLSQLLGTLVWAILFVMMGWTVWAIVERVTAFIGPGGSA